MAHEFLRPTPFARIAAGVLAAFCLAVLLTATGCSKPADTTQTTTQAQVGGPAGGPPGAGGARGNRRFGEVLQTLGLSDDQKEQIRKIMADARTQAKGETDPDARRSTMRAAFAKVQDILTPAQRDAFKAKMQALRNSSPHRRNNAFVRALQAVTALLLAAVLVAGCNRGGGTRRSARGAGTPNAVPTAAAKPATVRATSSISGVIAPLQSVAITSQLVEPADTVTVNEGDRVRAGQVVAQLDTADLQAQLEQAQATVLTDIRTAASDDAKVDQARFTQKLNIGQGGDQVQTARSTLAQAQQTFSNDTQNLARDQQLMSQGYIAQQTLDQQQTLVNNDQAAVRSAQATLQSAITNQEVNGTQSTGLQASTVAAAAAEARAAHATVQQAQASVRQLQVSIAKARIVSPVNGVVVNRNLNPGEYPNGRTLFTIQQLDHVYASLNASSADTFQIPVGAPVSLSVAGAAGRTYSGKVVAVLGQVAPGSTNFTVKVVVANPDEKLQSGLPVTATTTLPAVSGVGIPTTAFLDETHTTVMLADDQLVDVIAKTVHVHELGSNGTTSIVSGLKAGDKVVTNGQLGISDGQSLSADS